MLLQNIDALTRKAEQDIKFYNKILAGINLTKNNIILGNNTELDDNLTRIKWSELELILENTHPKYSISMPDSMPQFINCSGSDSGLKVINNVSIGADSFSLGPNSGVEGASRVLQAVDSTVCEIFGICMALKTAKQLKIRALCHCVDNQSALAIASKAIQFRVSQCDSLDKHLETYPFLKQVFSDLYDLKSSFDYLSIIWTRGHNDTNLTNIFTTLNNQTDELCSALIAQQERLLCRN